MNNFLEHVPGFRSNTRWKRIVALIYYIFSLFMFIGGLGFGLMALSAPFMIFYLVDVIKNKDNKPVKSLIVFIVAIMLFVTGTGVTSAQQAKIEEQKLAEEQARIEEEERLQKELEDKKRLEEEQKRKEEDERKKVEEEEQKRLEEEKVKQEEAAKKAEEEKKQKELEEQRKKEKAEEERKKKELEEKKKKEEAAKVASNTNTKAATDNSSSNTTKDSNKAVTGGTAKAQSTAKATGGNTKASPPKENPNPITSSYLANANTKKFHISTCTHAKKIADKNRVPFSNRDDAVKQGYTPCKVCKP